MAALKYVGLAAMAALVDATEPDRVAQVSDLLARGAAAEVSGDREAMAAAAAALDQLGAHPVDGTTDAAASWRTPGGRAVYRGRALGPAYQSGTLPPRSDAASEQVFLAGQRAVVALVPAPGHTLQLRIASSSDGNICTQPATPPRALCNWVPVFTARVEIRISNPGDKAARYYLVSN